MKKSKGGIYRKIVKRPMDFVLSTIALIVLSPILLVVSILIRLKLGSPIIFKQTRAGLHGKAFTIYKFRSMTNGRDKNGELLPDKLRLTKFGKFLRSTSLDELPELWNILKGDMSIIGPRPLHVRYLPLYDEFQRQRHDTKPGLSGLAQINGRNSISWEERLKLDVKYVKNITFLGDCKIIILTIIDVFRREGINSSDDVTMPAFTGTDSNEKNPLKNKPY